MPKNLEVKYESHNCHSTQQSPCAQISNTFYQASRYINEYDIYRKCYYDQKAKPSELPRKDGHLACIYKGPLQDMLNDKDFKRAFNVDLEGVPHWQHCNEIQEEYPSNTDIVDYTVNVHSVIPAYQKLRHKYKLLIFVGDTDELLGFGYAMRGVRELGWETVEEFKQWYLEGEMIGYKWVVDGMTLATIHGVGHMAAAWKPREVQSLIYKFIEGSF